MTAPTTASKNGLSGDCLVSGRLARVELDPETSVAERRRRSSRPQQVLVNSWCQQIRSHSVGDIEFDAVGALLMTGGDGASWGSSDYGHHGNWCNDPFIPTKKRARTYTRAAPCARRT